MDPQRAHNPDPSDTMASGYEVFANGPREQPPGERAADPREQDGRADDEREPYPHGLPADAPNVDPGPTS